MALSANFRGALFMSVGMAGFTINDALFKTVLTGMNIGQGIFLRGVFATLLLFLLASRNGSLGQFPLAFRPSVSVRVCCEMAATVTFVLALIHMPLADVSAVLQALPLAVTMGAALVFSEPVGWRRWCAILAGFVGVLIIVRPGAAGFNLWSLSAVATVGFCAIRDLSTRVIPSDTPTVLVSLATSAAVSTCGAVLIIPFGGWETPELSEIAILSAAAVALIFGYQFTIMALRQGDMSFMAPFRYTSLLWAILLGFLIFRDVPDGPMLLGSAIVIASGLYALYREQIVARQRPIAESTAPGMAPDGT